MPNALRTLIAAVALTMAPTLGVSPAMAAASQRNRIAMLAPRAPDHYSVYVDLTLASLLPGAAGARAKSRGDDLAALLEKEQFDIAKTLALQVSAALPEVGLRRVAFDVSPNARNKSDGHATMTATDCGCDYWLDLVIVEAGFRADTHGSTYQPMLTVDMGLIGALGHRRVASKTFLLRAAMRTPSITSAVTGANSRAGSHTVSGRAGDGFKSFEAILADGKGAARALRNALADMATDIAQEAAQAAGVRVANEEAPDDNVAPPPDE